MPVFYEIWALQKYTPVAYFIVENGPRVFLLSDNVTNTFIPNIMERKNTPRILFQPIPSLVATCFWSAPLNIGFYVKLDLAKIEFYG